MDSSVPPTSLNPSTTILSPEAFVELTAQAYTPQPYNAVDLSAQEQRRCKQEEVASKFLARQQIAHALNTVPPERLVDLLNAIDAAGDTILHKIVKGANWKWVRRPDPQVGDLLERLLEKGADPDRLNAENKTAENYIDGRTLWAVKRSLHHVLRTVGDINQRRIAERAAHYAHSSRAAAALAAQKKAIAAGGMRQLIKLFSNLDNALLPAMIEEALCFATATTEQAQLQYGFLTAAEEVAHSLLRSDGSLSAHVQRGPYPNVPYQGNNLIMRVVEHEGQKEMRGLVFPDRYLDGQGRELRRSHNQAYSQRYGAFWFAGEIAANSSGQIIYLSNKSGHNLTGELELSALVQYLHFQKRLDLANFTVEVMHKSGAKALLQGAQAIESTGEALSRFSNDLATIGLENLGNQYQEFKSVDLKHASEEQLASLTRSDIKSFQQQRMQAYEHWQAALAAHRLLMNIGFEPSIDSIDPNRSLPLRPYC